VTRGAPALVLILTLVGGSGVCGQASAQTQAEVTIEIDAVAPGAPLEPVWAYFGYDEANYTNDPEGQELLRTLARAHATPVYIRTHFLFNTGDGTPALKWGSTNLYSEDADENPIYDFSIIDQLMDATALAGTTPLFEFGFMPKALSTRPEPYEPSGTFTLDSGSFYPPKDYEKWAGLVRAWAEHVKARYPGAESSWQWELWNEPDIGYWQGTPEEYARLYDFTESALHAVFPAAPLGGPAVARPEGTFLAEFLEHCSLGTNAVTGETGTRLDLVSFHAKGGVTLVDEHVQMDLGNQLRLHRAGFEAVVQSPEFSSTPVVISEADPDGCAACPARTTKQYAYRYSPAYGAYELAMMKRSLDLAAEMEVDLRGIVTWAFTFPNTPYFAGYRALSTNGIHLPVLNAFKLLASLRGDRLKVASSGALPLSELLSDGVRGRPDVDALAAKDGDRIHVLVWNYHDDLVAAEPAQVELRVSVPTAFEHGAVVLHRRVDQAHGDAFTVWQALGSPEQPSSGQRALLLAAMDATVLSPEQPVEVADGTVRLAFNLPRFGVSLLTLTPATEPGEEAESPAQGSASCACRMGASQGTNRPLLLAILPAIALTRRRRGTRRWTLRH
jgi:xylan 1,4-beta-xylosidase